MRSIWKGAITFGLVNVPVKLFSALEDHNVSLHQVHDADGGRIRYQRKCEVCGEVVDYAHIDKAFDDGERTVVLTDDDLASLPAERSREIDVVEFVPSAQIDPVLFDRTYYLEPDSSSPKAYELLKRTLASTERTAIVKFAMRQRTRLAALRVRNGVLTLQTLLWADEVRSPEFVKVDDSVKVTEKELKMSAALVDSFSADFDPTQYTDDYQVELTKLIDAKLESGDSIDTDATFGESPEETGEDAEVIDLMDALRRSVENSKAKRTSGTKTTGAKASPGTKASPRKRAPSAKKTPSSKKASSAKDEKKPTARKTGTA